MKLSKIFDYLYTKVFVAIVESKAKTSVCIEVSNTKGVIFNAEEIFEQNTSLQDIENFIQTYTKETPYHYVALLDTSTSQGVIPTCKRDRFHDFIDVNDPKTMCYHNRWGYFSAKADIDATVHRYDDIGVDFLFSPFVMLAKFFADKIDTSLAMFLLIHDDFVTLSVFDNSQLLYGKLLNLDELDSEETLVDDEELNLDDEFDSAIDLEDIETEGLEDFSNIEDLDSVDELDDFSDDRDVEEEFQDNIEKQLQDAPQQQEDENFNEDYQRFLFIQNSISDFYKNPKYESKFIESVYVADGVGLGSEFRKYLEEEMFLNVYVRTIDLNMELFELLKMELA